MASQKLIAEWFWTDRWMGSSAFLLPIEPRGLYREMLSQAWRRGARLPAHHESICRAVGCTPAEWQRAWPAIEKYWRVDGDSLVNDTQLEVYAEAQAIQQRASERGLKGANARAAHTQALLEQSLSITQATTQGVLEVKPPSPSPSPSLTPSQTPCQSAPTRPRALTGSGVMAGALPRDHLRHAWCGRVCVPDFLHGQFLNATGQPEEVLMAFYADTFTRIAKTEPVEPDALKFWRPMVTAKWAPEPPSNRITADDLVRTPEELARDEARDRRAAHGRY